MASVIQSSLELEHIAILLRIDVFIWKKYRDVFKLELHLAALSQSAAQKRTRTQEPTSWAKFVSRRCKTKGVDRSNTIVRFATSTRSNLAGRSSLVSRHWKECVCMLHAACLLADDSWTHVYCIQNLKFKYCRKTCSPQMHYEMQGVFYSSCYLQAFWRKDIDINTSACHSKQRASRLTCAASTAKVKCTEKSEAAKTCHRHFNKL